MMNSWLKSTLFTTFSLGALTASPIMGAEKKDQVLVYGETARLETADPYTAHEASAKRLADLLFDSLIEVGPGGTYRPALATKWIVSDSGSTVTFDLRDDVFWHAPKGAKEKVRLSAKDVVTTLRLLTAEGSEIPNKERFSSLKSAEALEPFKVKITLSRASVDPLKALMFKILPAHILGEDKALKRASAFAKHPTGTGPYQVAKINDQGEILLEANEKYFKGVPKIKSMAMRPFNDQSVMAQALMFNSLDLVTYVSPRDMNEISGDQKLGLIPYDALSFSFFAMNTDKGVLKDKRVRQAISHAVNRQEMLQAFFQNKGNLITGPFPPTSWAYNLDVNPMEFSPEKAKSLLEAAGLKRNDRGILLDRSGTPVKLNFAVPVAGESETIKRMVLALQSYLSEVGIPVELQFMDWLVWKKKVLRDHDYDMTIASWSFDDANNITSLFHSSSAKPWGNNFVLYRNPQVDAMLTEANATNDFDKKRMIYQKLHSILAEEAPYTYLWTLTHHAAHNSRVKGVRVEPSAFFRHVISWRLEGVKQDGSI